MPKKGLSLEDSFKRLDEILSELESGEVDLEKSIGLFEEAMALSEDCQKQLNTLEKRVKVLVAKGGGDYIEEDIQE
ncbi:exodeoxyribonuclease VII small subunit [bacterium]|nr:exodeoxyribonuclease VII small subunit [bacterium]MBU1066080.1 exodeoxyribonuclease VII small subunit [bacterium]MBU1635375.1 exodeoxyribonuclease VII small subunit [bacterium]MBU1874520.1 exodeoxyribonuclease VII small subunit [bacterium]